MCGDKELKTKNFRWTDESGWNAEHPNTFEGNPDLGLIFGGRELIQTSDELQSVSDRFPAMQLIGCSTAGEIDDTMVRDQSLVVTLVDFDTTETVLESVKIESPENSLSAGETLAHRLSSDKLEHVFVLSDGLSVNGSELVRGLDSNLPEGVQVSGGLAGDADKFEETYLVLNDQVTNNAVGAVGFYGDDIRIGYGSQGGWDPFGPERLITKSNGNVLYELDGKPALDLYKRYLGDHADDLPASGLLFPLSVRDPDSENDSLVRTILSVDEDERSMTFAGDLPEGDYARLMKANFDRLIDGAQQSADNSVRTLEESDPKLAVLISCVGRKLILKQRTEEELEVVRDVLGGETSLTGFYSYGEISPFSGEVDHTCQLHNQTMTITTFSEE